MRRKQVFTRGRLFSVIVAGVAGYVVGGWNASTPRSSELSASQTVALRFPQDLDDASPITTAFATPANAAVLAGSQVALLSPVPMVPRSQSAAAQASTPAQPALQMASAEAAVPQPVPAPAVRPTETKPAAAAVHRSNDRPGFILNDAQIASIKGRLHLTQDQQEMWPAVEAALRNLAYARSREARGRSGPANTMQLASNDSNGTDVQDLKSAAIPLIMSFNTEQKDEVRNLAHVMGLDQLANQF
jgi:hypothetical protein